MKYLTLTIIAASILLQQTCAYDNSNSYTYNTNGLHYSPGQLYGANYPYTSNSMKVPANVNYNSYSNVPSQNILPPFPSISMLPPKHYPHPDEYANSINKYVNSIQKQIASGGSFAYSTPGASAYAYASGGQANLFQQQQALWDAWRSSIRANSVPYAYPSYAAASAQYSPNGFQQHAAIYPPNSNIPNVNTQFASSNGPNGFYGISTSAFSSSSNVNGVETNQRGAYTTVNDNGKISTYKVES